MAEALFESNWSATKDALLEGLNGSKEDDYGDDFRKF